MDSHSLKVMGAAATLIALVLTGCAKQQQKAEREKPLRTEGKEAQLTRYRMKNWSARDDHTVVIESYDGTQYMGETLGPCLGLEYTTRLAFKNRSGFQDIDRFSTIVLQDGTTCQLQTFSKVITPESTALDSYEKSQKDKTPDEMGKEEAKKKKPQ